MSRAVAWAALLLLSACGAGDVPAVSDAASVNAYVFRPGSPDGIGKFYMGREIAHVMGHLGAGWLERDSRVAEERTDLLLDNLPMEPDDVVVDLGAGTGYFTLPMAARVPEGRVLAVDIQPEMLAIVRERVAAAGIRNVETVLATEIDPRLPRDSVDLVLLVDAYHEFSYPREVMLKVAAALRPGGKVVLIEYRGEDPAVPIKELHKMTQEQARRELAAAGLAWVETRDILPQQHFMVFAKAAPPSSAS
ncbi:MAG: class I SAM-dependent methyltransferase [Gammaproteobacteria bacterium]|nr:class I SAM-dependent methyltransferase [Gammaproteobacteria bacterium]